MNRRARRNERAAQARLGLSLPTARLRATPPKLCPDRFLPQRRSECSAELARFHRSNSRTCFEPVLSSAESPPCSHSLRLQLTSCLCSGLDPQGRLPAQPSRRPAPV